MYGLAPKNKCTACGNCILSCSRNAIAFERDILDNIYPKIDVTKCIECGQCKKVCPALNTVERQKPFECYAAYINNLDKRKKSASGRLATAIYEYAIENGFWCIGVRLNEKYEAHYHMIKNKDDLIKFRNSKYTFSFLDDIFLKILECLKKDQKIVFCGLPCQVAALIQYLSVNKISSEGLVTIGIICHGVPSDEYLKNHIASITKGKISCSVNFRDYHFGTYNFNFSLTDRGNIIYRKPVEGNDNYQIGYHNATIYRQNCYECSYANAERTEDITLGDFSGLGKYASIDIDITQEKQKGISCVLINTNKGKKLIEALKENNRITLLARPISEALEVEQQLQHPSKPSAFYNDFIKLYPQKKFTITCNKIFKCEKVKRVVMRKIKNIAKKILRR